MRIKTFVLLAQLFKILTIAHKWGFIVAFDHVRNRFKRWELSSPKEATDQTILIGSSLSDTLEYQRLCAAAISDKYVLTNFKSEKNYTRILEHVNYELGLKYLDFLEGDLVSKQALLTVNRVEIGNPEKYHFPGLGLISPTQIRYAKILRELTGLFGPLDDMKVIEIGVGNGGQCFQICNFYKISEYALYDLEVVQQLTELVLETQGLTKGIKFPKIFPLEENHCDLFISNYAFSELTRENQEIYFEKIIRHSRRGYMIFNHIHPIKSSSMDAREFISRMPGSVMFEEVPLTHEENVLIVWGHELAVVQVD